LLVLTLVKALFVLNKYFWRYKKLFFWGILFVIISNVLSVLPARLVRQSIDLIAKSIENSKSINASATGNTDLTYQLFIFGIITLALALGRGLFMYFMRQTIIVMSRWIEFDMKNEIYGKYQKLGSEFYQKYSTGDLMSRLSEDVGRVRMYVGPAYMYGINMIVLFSLTLVSMLNVNYRLTLFVLIPLPFLAFGIYFVNRLIEKRSARLQAKLSEMTSFSQEAYSGIRVIKTFGREKVFGGLFTNVIGDYRKEALGLARIDSIFQPVTLLIIGSSVLITVLVGGIETIRGNATVGNIAEFIIYVNMLTFPIMSVGWVAGMIQRAAVSQKRINDLMNEPEGIDSNEGVKIKLEGKIEFKNVSFSYSPTSENVLNDISFSLLSGQTLGIVGKTGAGKSTLIKLLLRQYKPSTGSILIDANPIEKIDLGRFREQTGYVPQDVFLFSESIRDNIAFGKAGASDTEIVEAAINADVDKDIKHFTYQYDTLLGERGITLSGGQKQRVAIARALIKKPSLFIFDDALAAVDTETEKSIIQSLTSATQSISTIIVSHRLSALRHADLILYIGDNTILERGTHDELLAIDGHYAELYRLQLEKDNSNGQFVEV